MRVLAVDYGEKRVGLAISDAMEITANPLGMVERTGPLSAVDAVANHLAGVVAAEDIEEVVVGLPLNFDGSRGPAAEAAQALADALAARVSVPVRMHDEYLTSSEAEGMLGPAGRRQTQRRRRSGQVDKAAATVLLQDYLRSRPRR